MRSLSRRRVGWTLVVAAVAAVALSLGGTALVAPPIEKTDDTRDGATLATGQSDGVVTAFDGTGDVVWNIDVGDKAFDATRLDDGTVLVAVTYEDVEDCGRFDPPCGRTGFKIVDPGSDPRVVREWTIPVRGAKNSEVHDVEPLPSGEILVADMEYERLITVAENGSVTWRWNASERYDEPADPTATDWLHVNDVDTLGDGRYLVSVRNADELLIVERGEGVVEVIEGVADGRADRVLFEGQHNPQYLSDDALLVADSENDRIVEIHRENDRWTIAWSMASANGLAFDWPRDADRLENGNTLITDSRRHRVVEVAPDGSTVWSVRGPHLVYEADRLSEGERVGAQSYGDAVASDGEASSGGRDGFSPFDGGLPLFGAVHESLTHVVRVPYWLRPWHLAVIAAAIPTAVAGLALVWRNRSDE
ncbi:arylsulfotransferase family protein [Natrinema sp. 74]|uniref:arylsulfotransferase family protein n=1 Tax=Natrinema sp. 74 TaxID=3384159 RepID=UPI0038D4FE15